MPPKISLAASNSPAMIEPTATPPNGVHAASPAEAPRTLSMNDEARLAATPESSRPAQTAVLGQCHPSQPCGDTRMPHT